MFLAKTKFFIGFSGTIRVNIVCNDKSNIYQKKKKKKKKKLAKWIIDRGNFIKFNKKKSKILIILKGLTIKLKNYHLSERENLTKLKKEELIMVLSKVHYAPNIKKQFNRNSLSHQKRFHIYY